MTVEVEYSKAGEVKRETWGARDGMELAVRLSDLLIFDDATGIKFRAEGKPEWREYP